MTTANVREAHLPSWATAIGPGKIEVNAEEFYQSILREIGITLKQLEDDELTRYDLELAKTIMKLDVRLAIAGTALMPESGGAATIHIVDDSKKVTGVSRWAQASHEKGRGADAGAKAARGEFKRLRGIVVA